MRTLFITLMAVSVVCSMAWGDQREHPGYAYTGEIIFKDSSKVTYNFLYSTLAGDELSYSKDIMDMKNSTLNLPRVRLSGVSGIDFIDFSDSEKRLIKSANLKSEFRKTKVTFRDGAIYDDIYLDLTLGKWEGYRESGNLYSPKISSITVNIKGAKECPKCSRQFKENGWKYCPFDGSALK